ncbi:MAG: aldehyde dehydrogenase family protein, partial [Thermoleophilia bacterium]
QEEIFGPVVSILAVDSFDEAIAVANSTRYGLSSSIYTRDVNAAFRAIEQIDAGITYVNGPTIGAEVHLPFGGTRDTGNGHRESGTEVLNVFSEWKSVYVDYSERLQRAQIDTGLPGGPAGGATAGDDRVGGPRKAQTDEIGSGSHGAGRGD